MGVGTGVLGDGGERGPPILGSVPSVSSTAMHSMYRECQGTVGGWIHGFKSELLPDKNYG